MTDKYSPHVQMWTASQCARLFGYRNADAWKYAAHVGRVPKPCGFDGCAAVWSAKDVRAWYTSTVKSKG